MYYIEKERCTHYHSPLGIMKIETGDWKILFMDSDETKVKELYNSLKKDNHFIYRLKSINVKF